MAEKLPEQKWIVNGRKFILENVSTEYSKLPVAIYRVELSKFGFYLNKLEDEFKFEYKLYGLEESLINRITKTYEHTDSNLGVLLNGIKGTGKTVSSKVICNNLKLPVIIVDVPFDGLHAYLNAIPQDIVIFIDEYEKVYEEKSTMLTIMDGALDSEFRRVFLFTTNSLYINENLLQRPGRIRYLKTFKDLSAKIVEEIIDDCLIYKEHKDKTIEFISQLETITIDIVKAICQEINIHNEPPTEFESVFNVKKMSGKYDVYQLIDGKEKLFRKNTKVSPRTEFDIDDAEGRSFYIDNDYMGSITKVLDKNVIEVTNQVIRKKLNDESKLVMTYSENRNEPTPVEEIKTLSKSNRGDSIENDAKDEDDEQEAYDNITATYIIENSVIMHGSYRWNRNRNFPEYDL